MGFRLLIADSVFAYWLFPVPLPVRLTKKRKTVKFYFLTVFSVEYIKVSLRFGEILNSIQRAINFMIRQFVSLQFAGQIGVIRGQIHQAVAAPIK